MEVQTARFSDGLHTLAPWGGIEVSHDKGGRFRCCNLVSDGSELVVSAIPGDSASRRHRMDAVKVQFSRSDLKVSRQRGFGIWPDVRAHLKFMDDTQLLQRQAAEERDPEVVRLWMHEMMRVGGYERFHS